MDPAEYASQSLFHESGDFDPWVQRYGPLCGPRRSHASVADPDASAFVYALSIFYLPNYQCVQLAYFDAAKEDMPEFRSRRTDFSDGPGSF